jgi:hypothetical protein
MHHPVQYQVTAKIIQKDRLRAAQAHRLAKQSGRKPSDGLGLPFRLLGVLGSLLLLPTKALWNRVKVTRDVWQYYRKLAGRIS